MNSKKTAVSLSLCAAATFFMLTGCAYMHDRGNDAMDILDIGVAVNREIKPQFALYFDFFNVVPLGYSKVEALSIGMGNRQLGVLDFTHDSWGVLAVGEEKKGNGVFNPYDPRQARSDQTDLENRPEFDIGFVGSFKGERPPPDMQFMECDRILYLGWIGVHATLRPVDLLDFVIGWTTLDILNDDNIKTPGE